MLSPRTAQRAPLPPLSEPCRGVPPAPGAGPLPRGCATILSFSKNRSLFSQKASNPGQHFSSSRPRISAWNDRHGEPAAAAGRAACLFFLANDDSLKVVKPLKIANKVLLN